MPQPDDTEEHKQRRKETYKVLKEATDKVKAKLEAAEAGDGVEVRRLGAMGVDAPDEKGATALRRVRGERVNVRAGGGRTHLESPTGRGLPPP